MFKNMYLIALLVHLQLCTDTGLMERCTLAKYSMGKLSINISFMELLYPDGFNLPPPPPPTVSTSLNLRHR